MYKRNNNIYDEIKKMEDEIHYKYDENDENKSFKVSGCRKIKQIHV